MESIPGIGDILSMTLLGYVGDMSRFSSNKALVAYAGLNPMLKESGLWKRPDESTQERECSVTKGPNMPAITALKYNPVISALCSRLREKGKRGKYLT